MSQANLHPPQEPAAKANGAPPPLKPATSSATVAFVLPLDQVEPSKTNPRKSFAGPEMDELAESIRQHGVLQPILVRHPAMSMRRNPATLNAKGEWGGDKYQIVCGERRYRAAKQAGITEIPVVVRELSDEQALEIQIVENLQRQDVTALEEAEGYAALAKQMQVAQPKAGRQELVAEIAKKIGKSVRYVYARMKLGELIPDLKKLLADGTLPASHADELVRLSPEVQAEILADDGLFDSFDDEDEEEPTQKRIISFRELKERISREYTRNLSSAPWKWDDANLVKQAGACKDCAKNSANDPGGDAKSAICRDKQCFGEKRAAFVQLQLAQATQEARERAGFVPGHTADMKAAGNKKAWKQAEAVMISPKSQYNSDIEKERRKGVYFGEGGYDASYAFAKPGECEYARPAVIVEGPETGHARTVCVEKSCAKHFKRDAYSGYSRPQSSRPVKTLAERKKERAKKYAEEARLEIAHEQLRAIQRAAEAQAAIGIEEQRRIAWKMYESLWQDRKKEVLKFLGLEILKRKHQYGSSLDCDQPIRQRLQAMTSSGQIAGFQLLLACFTDALSAGDKQVVYCEDKPDRGAYEAMLQRLKIDAAGLARRVHERKQAEREIADRKDEEREAKAKEKAARAKEAGKKPPPRVEGELQTSAKPPVTIASKRKCFEAPSRQSAGSGAKSKSGSSPKPQTSSKGKQGGRK